MLAASACGGTSAGPVDPSDSLDGVPPCPGAPPPTPIGGTVALRMFAGVGIDPVDVTTIAADVQAFFAPYGIVFETAGAGQEVPTTAILGGTAAEIEAAFATGGDTAALDIVLQPLLGFLTLYSSPQADRVHLVVVERIADDRSAATAVLGEVAGLGLAPMTDLLPPGLLPDRFTPTTFVGLIDLAAMDPVLAATTVAHEVAHALGLGHDQRSWNLMSPDRDRCVPGLDAEQAATLKGRTIG